jgi:hypothetical protein
LHYVFKKRLGMTPAQYRQRQQAIAGRDEFEPMRFPRKLAR